MTSRSPSNEDLAADPVHDAFLAELDRCAEVLGKAWLRPVVDATTVTVRDGETLVTDGPFAETKDFVGGEYVVAGPTMARRSHVPSKQRRASI